MSGEAKGDYRGDTLSLLQTEIAGESASVEDSSEPAAAEVHVGHLKNASLQGEAEPFPGVGESGCEGGGEEEAVVAYEPVAPLQGEVFQGRVSPVQEGEPRGWGERAGRGEKALTDEVEGALLDGLGKKGPAGTSSLNDLRERP